MSPRCLSSRGKGPQDAELQEALDSMKTAADAATLPFLARVKLARAAEWSPDPIRRVRTVPPNFLKAWMASTLSR
jgi:hypothetical protein